jgi:hypothetical protein
MNTLAYPAVDHALYVGNDHRITNGLIRTDTPEIPDQAKNSLYVRILLTNEVYELRAQPALSLVHEYQAERIPLEFFIGERGKADRPRG